MTFDFNTDITTGDTTGTGIFDLMMKSVKAHLLEEFNARRIRGEDYSTVYLGALQSSMQQAIQYKIGMEQADVARLLANINIEKTEAELLLIAQKTITEKGQVESVDAGLIGLQQDLQAKELLKADEEINLVAQKVITEKGQVEDVADGLIGKQQTLVHEQAAGVVADKALTQQRIATELAQVQDIPNFVGLAGRAQQEATAKIQLMGKQEDLMDQDILVKQQDVLVKQQDVLESAEKVKLTAAQVNTEKAQVNNSTSGIVGKQQLKLTAETDHIEKQTSLLDTELLIKQQQLIIETAKVNIIAQELLKITSEAELIAAKVITEQAQTAGASVAGAGSIGGLMGAQIDKITTEGQLLTAKVTTESAQTSDVAGGLIGKQQTLYAAQAHGFKQKAVTDAAKLYANAYNVQRSTLVDTATPGEFTASAISTAIANAMSTAQAGP